MAGADISFTFPRKLNIEYKSDFTFLYDDRYAEKLAYKYGCGMRFGITPYIALGINFGKIKKQSVEKVEEEIAEEIEDAEIEDEGEVVESEIEENLPVWMPPLNFNVRR